MVRQGKGPLKSEASEIEQDVSVGLCASIKVLKTNPHRKEGMALLKKLASLMAPIMRKHGWELPLLTEFFPDNPNLLGMNVNRGQKILIRLRHAHTPDAFIDLESELVGTMLHELTHNVHGPHDQAFYKYLDSLNDEYDALRSSGYSGEGFLSNGKKLSTAQHDAHLPLHVARQRALAEAERRQKVQKIMGPPGGQRLGGGKTPRTAKTPKQLILEAAERRQRDEKRCGHDDLAQDEAAKAANQAVTIDISDDEADLPDTQPPASGSKATLSQPASAESDDDEVKLVASSSKPTPRPNQKRKRSPSPKTASSQWSCPACTFANENQSLQCGVCERPRDGLEQILEDRDKAAFTARPPMPLRDGWTCHTCGYVTEHQWWSCQQCGTIKLSS